jgi:hypothetical protein
LSKNDKKNKLIQRIFKAGTAESYLLFPGKEIKGGDVIADQIRKAEKTIVESENYYRQYLHSLRNN